MIRLDSGFFQSDIMDYLEQRNTDFIIAAKFTHPIQRLIADNKAWIQLDEGIEICEQNYQSDSWEKERRLIIVRQKIKGRPNAPLRNETGQLQQAVTHYRRLKTAELDIPFVGFATSRYSLLEVMPETGRMHQIRRHLAHIFHPVIGDRPHGCNKQNRLFLQQFQHSTLLLHAVSLRFVHPVSNLPYTIEASYQPEFLRIMPIMGWAE